MEPDVDIAMCLNLTNDLLIASLQSGKLEVKNGEDLAKCFDKVFGQICDCAKLTSPAFINLYSQRKQEEAAKRTSLQSQRQGLAH